ncbi:RCC1 and BTB domain-containing protein 1 [Acromyrmex echinatior]|uniref:RCC1 and BTB domain-containing protein 1 n=1 Tax=Acromyrmex echinatior TaxID=103372 RepID=F4WYH7_ACREC|nr:RCC1 and BTB domain-containing protein 1 [Acromyrmex echinatior]
MFLNLRSWSSLKPKFISEIHMVMLFGKLGKSALIVTKDKKVYDLMNDNLHALKSREKSSAMLYLKEIKDLCRKDIKTFAYGRGSHMLALTNGGEMYAWKSNNSEQAGNSTYRLPITPKLILSNVGCISCGDNFNIAVTRNGKVYDSDNNDINAFEKISELFDLANAYCKDNLKKQYIYRIKQEITVSNVYFYNFAVKYETEVVKRVERIRFAVIHMRVVVKTKNFAKLEDEKLINRFINEASKAGCFKN